MTNAQFSTYMTNLYQKLMSIRQAAHKEYAQRNPDEPDNVFANFERHGQILRIPKQKIWAVYASKHWDGILSHIAGNTKQREPVTGRVEDLIVYLLLFHGMESSGAELEKLIT